MFAKALLPLLGWKFRREIDGIFENVNKCELEAFTLNNIQQAAKGSQNSQDNDVLHRCDTASRLLRCSELTPFI